MALSSCPTPKLIEDSSLTDWTVIGSGGFGQIYKARHRTWCCDVAIKLLHFDDGSSKSLLHEIDMMQQGRCPYVLQVLGIFKGRPPSSGPSIHLGLVMEVMERGSLASLQVALGETPPWPLAFRLAHQVALGVNFLHNLSPPVLHLDLKPSNVLLDCSLNAKLTDFGLARVYHSVTRSFRKDSEEGGTISYMPPEAFDMSYSPTQASDIYSYGILLWSVVTGKQPYPNAMPSMVRFRIPQGDRPSLDEIKSLAAVIAGLTGLMDLMEKCWVAKPNQRPSSYDCTTVTEELYKIHKHGIVDTVHHVLKKLDENKEESVITELVRGVHITQPSVSRRVEAVNAINVLTGRLPVQEMANGFTVNEKNKARLKDRPVNVCDTDMSRSSKNDHEVKVSSVHPIHSSSQFPSPGRSPQVRVTKPLQEVFRQNPSLQYHRQLSNPETFSHCPPAAAPGVIIRMSNVTGFQLGDNNTMHIYAPHLQDRKRHPTAPSSVSVPQPHAGSRKGQDRKS